MTIFAVTKFYTITNSTLFRWHVPSGRRAWLTPIYGGGILYFDYGGTSNSNGRVASFYSASNYVNKPILITAMARDGLRYAKLNRITLDQETTHTATIDVGSSSTFAIGANIDAVGYDYNGQISELIIFRRGLKNSEIEQVENYLIQKYSLKL